MFTPVVVTTGAVHSGWQTMGVPEQFVTPLAS